MRHSPPLKLADCIDSSDISISPTELAVTPTSRNKTMNGSSSIGDGIAGEAGTATAIPDASSASVSRTPTVLRSKNPFRTAEAESSEEALRPLAQPLADPADDAKSSAHNVLATAHHPEAMQESRETQPSSQEALASDISVEDRQLDIPAATPQTILTPLTVSGDHGDNMIHPGHNYLGAHPGSSVTPSDSNQGSQTDFGNSVRNSVHSFSSFQHNPRNRASYIGDGHVDLDLPQAESSDTALAPLTVRSPVLHPASSPPPSAQPIIPAPLTFNPPKDNITFQVKVIKWRTPANYLVNTPIILQDENGPCPFIALVNTLVFTESMSPIPPGPGRPISALLENKELVSKNLLLDHLGQWLLSISNRHNGPVVDPDDLNMCLRLLPELYSGLNINPRFDGTFEEGPELALFRAFEVDVVHGWIADPKEPYYDDVIEVGSYDAAQMLQIEATEEGPMKHKEREALHRQLAATFDFMDENPSQLTTYGIRYIEEILMPGSVCVFFRNNHFATLYKQPTSGRLFSLVTDQELCGRNGIVWISLEGTTGTDDTFYSGGFDQIQLMTEEEQEESRRRAFQTVESTNDFNLAKQIQEQDDAEYAREVQAQADQTRRRPQAAAATSKKPKAGKTGKAGKASKSKPEKTKKSKDGKDKKCIVM